MDLPPFTLVGATTRAGDLTAPLRDRFGIISQLEFYTLEELSRIVSRTAKVMDTEIASDAVTEIALRRESQIACFGEFVILRRSSTAGSSLRKLPIWH